MHFSRDDEGAFESRVCVLTSREPSFVTHTNPKRRCIVHHLSEVERTRRWSDGRRATEADDRTNVSRNWSRNHGAGANVWVLAERR